MQLLAHGTETRENPIRTRDPPFDSLDASRCIAFQYHIPVAAGSPLIQSYFKRGSSEAADVNRGERHTRKVEGHI